MTEERNMTEKRIVGYFAYVHIAEWFRFLFFGKWQKRRHNTEKL
jgi:hypothetical protein